MGQASAPLAVACEWGPGWACGLCLGGFFLVAGQLFLVDQDYTEYFCSNNSALPLQRMSQK